MGGTMTESGAAATQAADNKPETVLSGIAVIFGIVGVVLALLGAFGKGGETYPAFLAGLVALSVAAQAGIALALFRAWKVERNSSTSGRP